MEIREGKKRKVLRDLGASEERKIPGGFDRRPDKEDSTGDQVDGSTDGAEKEVVFFDQSLRPGKRWRTEDGSQTLIIETQAGDWFSIILYGPQNEVLKKVSKERKDLQKMLWQDNYSLLSETEKTDNLNPNPPFGGASEVVNNGEDSSQDHSVSTRGPNESSERPAVTGPRETGKRVEKVKTPAIDEQITLMETKLRKLKSLSKVFDREATLVQKAARKKLIEELESGVRNAEKRKEDLATGAAEARVRREGTGAPRQVLKDQIQEVGLANEDKKFTERDAESLVRAMYGDDVFTRKDNELAGNVPGRGKRQARDGRVVSAENMEVSAIDKQVTSMKSILEGREYALKQLDKHADSEQKTAERKKLTEEMEVLRRGIEDAEKRKAELAASAKKARRAERETEGEQRVINGGDDDFTPDEGEEQHLRAGRRVARAKEEERKKKEREQVAEQLELSIGKNYGWPKRESDGSAEQTSRAQEEPPMEIPDGSSFGSFPKSTWELADNQEEEKIVDDIAELRRRVDDARKEYVNKDYDDTNKWLQIKNFFRGIKQGRSSDYEDYRDRYNNTLLDLRNAELAEIRRSGLQGKAMKEALAGTLKYFTYDELMNLAKERDQVRIEHSGLGGRAMGMVEAIGRGYRGLSFKKKILISATMWGLSGVTGGASLLLRRMLAGAGSAVAMEAVIEKISDKRQGGKAEERARQEVEELERNYKKEESKQPETQGNPAPAGEIFFSEDNLRRLNEKFEQAIFSLDEKLQQKKREVLWRKAAAFGIGFGTGYLARELLHFLGADELVKETKESLMHGLGLSESPAILPDAQTAMEAKTNLIKGFVNSDIIVEKGNSVWDVSGRLADKLSLEEGPKKTYFIDALKDKFGDIPLVEGENINFAEHGIDENFVKQTLEQSGALTPEQLAQISENNTRLTAFAEANPEVKLTNEITGKILNGEPISPVEVASPADAPGTEAVAGEDEYVPVEGEIPPELEALSLNEWYKQIFKIGENVQFGDRILGKDAIESLESFKSLKLQDVLHDAKLFQQGVLADHRTGLDLQKITNFAKFFQDISKSKIIDFDSVKFLRGNPDASLMDYLRKAASYLPSSDSG